MSKCFQASAYVLAALLVMTLVGCGFYLKGDRPLPAELSEVYVNYGYGYGTMHLGDTLRSGLARRGTRLVSEATAPNVLSVYALEEETRVLSVGKSGYAIEYEIELTVDFDFQVNGQSRVPRQKITVLRDYSSDETRILASEAEAEGLRNAMQEELANLILIRIDAQLANPPVSDPPVAEPAG